MVYALYLASFSSQSEPLLLYSRSFSDGLPVKTAAMNNLCTFNLQGIASETSDLEEEPQQLLRVYEGNDILDYVLREGKTDFMSASSHSSQKEKNRDFISGTFRIRDSDLVVHWMSTLKGTALIIITAPNTNPAIVRLNLRIILSSLANRVRLDRPREVLVKPHVVALTLKYYIPCGELLLHPQTMQKQVEETISKLLK